MLSNREVVQDSLKAMLVRFNKICHPCPLLPEEKGIIIEVKVTLGLRVTFVTHIPTFKQVSTIVRKRK